METLITEPQSEPISHEFQHLSPTTNHHQQQQNDELENEYESDGLDPLFTEPTVKRVLDFDSFSAQLSDEDTVFEPESVNKRKETDVDLGDFAVKKARSRTHTTKKDKPVKSLPNEKRERKARLAQQADFQRVMRERKGVGFKPAPMVEKSISTVLEKIRQRKAELLKKLMPSKEIELDVDSDEDDHVTEIFDGRPQNAVETSINAALLCTTIENELHSSNEQITSKTPLADDTTQSFRVPVNDTQDLFVDSERSISLNDDSNEPSSPAEDIDPTAPSLNLQLDSEFADDNSYSDEESDKENVDPHPKHLPRGNSNAIGDPVKEFMDEEAVDDDSDNDRFLDKDEEDISDMEENCDYIATDVVEKQIDQERNNLYHQQWQQQEDEAGTEKLLQKLNRGTKREAKYLDDEDANNTEDEGDESDKEADFHEDNRDESDNEFGYGEDEKGYIAPGVTTKKLRQMIPQMFTDKDDVYVSSEDEEMEKNWSKQHLVQQRGIEKKSNFVSPAKEKASKEVFDRIKKLNVIPETKKKTKITSFFDPLLAKGNSSSFSKSSFLRRSSSNVGSSNNRRGKSTVRSYIFGRDDSNSRSSLPDDSQNLGEKEPQTKKNGTAKFVSSQTKLSTQLTQIETTSSGKSLFDILKCSSVQTNLETSDEMVVDDQLKAVFASFKTVKKHTTKIEGRSY